MTLGHLHVEGRDCRVSGWHGGFDKVVLARDKAGEGVGGPCGADGECPDRRGRGIGARDGEHCPSDGPVAGVVPALGQRQGAEEVVSERDTGDVGRAGVEVDRLSGGGGVEPVAGWGGGFGYLVPAR